MVSVKLEKNSLEGVDILSDKYVMLTFKQDELWLYEDICSHTSKSAYIKDILKQHIKKPQSFSSQANEEHSNKMDILFDGI